MNTLLATLAEPHVRQALWLTTQVALATLLIHGLLALALGWALARPAWLGRSLLDALVTLPLVFPPVASGFLLLMLLGRRGPFGAWLASHGVELVFSIGGVLLASVIAGLPLAVKPVQAALEGSSARLAEAARVLGKHEWQVFLFVQLPGARRALATGLLLGLGRSLGEVGITLMLGGNLAGRTTTVSLEIFNAVGSGEFLRAGLLSAVLGVVSLLLFALLRRLAAPQGSMG